MVLPEAAQLKGGGKRRKQIGVNHDFASSYWFCLPNIQYYRGILLHPLTAGEAFCQGFNQRR